MEEIRNRNLPNVKLANREADVVRRNLVCVCRFAIKNLIDRACIVNIDDECEEFLNFCAIIEQVLLHNIKPQKTWYGGLDTNFWNYISAACRRVPNSCISSIAAIENIKSPAAKGRAFIRCALMEKRLSEYLIAALKQPKITKKFYSAGAIMLSDDANVLCGVLLGLNAIDFSFCLKGENIDLLGPLAVDYTPFLKFQQSIESISCDMDEMRELSNSSLSSSIMSEDVDEMTGLKIKLNNLQQKYKSVSEQKGYLEELVRLRDQKIQELQNQHHSLVNKLHEVEVRGQQEQHQLETVILELQGQLAAAKSEHRLLQHRMSMLSLQHHRDKRLSGGDIQMVDMAGDCDSMNRQFVDSLNDQNSLTGLSDNQHHTYSQSDNRSLLSNNSSQSATQEDSHSLIPLAGSLTEPPIQSSETKEAPYDITPNPLMSDPSAGQRSVVEEGSKSFQKETGTSSSAAGEDDVFDVVKDAADYVKGKNGEHVDQYYSLIAVEELEESLEEGNVVEGKKADGNSHSEGGQVTDDQKPRIKKSPVKSGSDDEISSEKSSKMAADQPEKSKQETKPEIKETTTSIEFETTKESSTVNTEAGEMVKSSSSEGSNPPQRQRTEESNSSDDRDPWELVSKENGSGRNSDENLDKVSQEGANSEDILSLDDSTVKQSDSGQGD